MVDLYKKNQTKVPSGDFRLNSRGAFDPVLVPQDDLGSNINTVSF